MKPLGGMMPSYQWSIPEFKLPAYFTTAIARYWYSCWAWQQMNCTELACSSIAE
jgi:hypothetical protein